MSEQRQKIYSTEFKESSVKLAIESAQPIAHMARELDINPNTFILGLINIQQLLMLMVLKPIAITASMMK